MLKKIKRLEKKVKSGLIRTAFIVGVGLPSCLHYHTGPLPTAHNFQTMPNQQLLSNLEYLLNQERTLKPESCKVDEEGFACDFCWSNCSSTPDNRSYSRGVIKFSGIKGVTFLEGTVVSVPQVVIDGAYWVGAGNLAYDDRFKAMELHNVLNEILKRKGIQLNLP